MYDNTARSYLSLCVRIVAPLIICPVNFLNMTNEPHIIAQYTEGVGLEITF